MPCGEKLLLMEISVLINDLFKEKFYQYPDRIEPLPRSGSVRKYYRLYYQDGSRSMIATFNENTEENEAFFYMSDFFGNRGLNVPEIYAVSEDRKLYFQQDLGNKTLFDLLEDTDQIELYYIKVLNHLLKFLTSTEGFDWEKTYPVKVFDRTSYFFDLNYFKYFVLKKNNVVFNEYRLHNEFSQLVDFIMEQEPEFFVYRDFQSKNIMSVDSDFYFIDYQGGRRGNLFYDLASLLYDSKANLPPELRNTLKDYFYKMTWQLHKLDKSLFDSYFYANVLIRKLQAFAAYVLRGEIENKTHFLLSIPYVIRDLQEFLESDPIPVDMPEFRNAVGQLKDIYPGGKKRLNVSLEINSFSYHTSGYPQDPYDNGGGFVFDCRSIPNPGRLINFKHLSGLDKPVQQWLNAKPGFEQFMGHVFKIVSQSLERYHNEGYTHLQVNFGCTGGQHRSVYCAEKLAQMLKEYYDLRSIKVNHLMRGKTWG